MHVILPFNDCFLLNYECTLSFSIYYYSGIYKILLFKNTTYVNITLIFSNYYLKLINNNHVSNFLLI